MPHSQKLRPPAKAPNLWLRPLPPDAKKPRPDPTYNPAPRASPEWGLEPNGHNEKGCRPKYILTANINHCQFEPTVPSHSRDASLDWRRWRRLDANTSCPPHLPKCRRAQVDRGSNRSWVLGPEAGSYPRQALAHHRAQEERCQLRKERMKVAAAVALVEKMRPGPGFDRPGCRQTMRFGAH